ncbi:MAG: hypothetical protein ABI807_01270 [Sporichthyaceae bacterium]
MHRRLPRPLRLLAALLTLAATVASAGPVAAAVEPVVGVRLAGGDVSWPNCPRGVGIPARRSPGNPMPLTSASFVVIGLTNGPGWYPNPCLADHVAWAKARGAWTSAYSMTTFPTAAQRRSYGSTGPWAPTTRAGRLRNAGYQQAMFNVASMATAGLDVPFVWVDVEPYPTHPWPSDVLANRQVVRGVVRAYEDNGHQVGFYSYDGGWRAVVGSWRKPRHPTWVPVGPVAHGTARASARCAVPSFSGGPVWLAQWVQDARDRDVTCPLLHGRREVAHPLTALLGSTYGPGQTGPEIATLQRGLHLQPQYVTGTFDARTRRVLLAFQALRALPLTGVATDLELSALGAGTVTPAAPSRLARVFTAYPAT